MSDYKADKVKLCHNCREILMLFPSNPKSIELEHEFDAKHRGHMTVIVDINSIDKTLYKVFKEETK